MLTFQSDVTFHHCVSFTIVLKWTAGINSQVNMYMKCVGRQMLYVHTDCNSDHISLSDHIKH